MPSLTTSVRRLRRRAFLGAYAGALSRHLAVALVGLGAAVLLARLAGLERGEAAWILAGAAAAPVTAWAAVRGRGLSEAGAAAWLDVATGRTGRVVTAFESRATEAAEIDAPALPRLRLKPVTLRVLPALGFVALALLVGVARPAEPRLVEVFEAPVERLREKLEALEEQVELDPEQADELRLALQRIEEETEAGSPEAAFEAMDRLDQRLSELAEGLEETASDLSEELAAAKALEDADGDLSESELGAMKDLVEKALSRMNESGLAKEMPEELLSKLAEGGLELPEGTELDAEKLSEMADKLKELMDGKLGKLAEAGLVNPQDLKSLDDLQDLAELTEEDLKEGGT